MRAKTPYNKAQGYATRSCCPSIAKAEMKSLEAEKLHHPIIPAARIIPIMPLKTTIKERNQALIISHNFVYIRTVLHWRHAKYVIQLYKF